jgi:protein O-GlcNAc transferase
MSRDNHRSSAIDARVTQWLNAALRHYQAGQIVEAQKLFRDILKADADNVAALHFLGITEHQLGRHEAAIDLLRRAIHRNGRIPDLHFNLGAILLAVGRLDEAAPHYADAVKLKPDFAEAHFELGNILALRGRPAEAAVSYQRAIAHDSRSFQAHSNLGNVLQQQGKLEEAIAQWRQAIAINPGFVIARMNLALAMKELGKLDEAVAELRAVVAAAPDYAEAAYNLGNAFTQQNNPEEAAIQHRRALELRPAMAEAKFGLCMAQLPVLYADQAQIAKCRQNYTTHLTALRDEVLSSPDPAQFARGVGAGQPFFLAYQGQNDRELQSIYGTMVCRIMAARYPPAALPKSPAVDEPVKVGIVSGFFRDHTIWKLFIEGWLSQLDRKRFRVFGYHTASRRDANTAKAASACDRFVHSPLSIDAWLQAIRADSPHILIYPEIGMDPVAAQLAALRLAPVQCVSWGHPETTGYSTMDYFLSSDLMEPPDGQDHYTERLLRLPNISIYYEPPELPPTELNRADLGLRADATVYWCAQSLYKYLPRFDDVFARIAKQVGDCQFTFIEYRGSARVNELFRGRLERAFAVHGLNSADYCTILPRLDRSRFVAAIGLCDIALDSIGWSGGNSTLESLAHDVPIVTVTDALMRSRHSAAILRMMGITDTIAETVDEYVEIAVRLATDVAWRHAIRDRIGAQKNRVYRDSESIAALQAFLDGVARQPVPGA